MKIYLTRHSKTLWNQEKRLQGWQDSPLTAEGIEDAKLLKARITELKIDYCYSSPIERAKATSEILFDHVLVDERLKEMNFGKYEGCLINELLNDPIYNRLWNLPDDDVSTPGGETKINKYVVRGCSLSEVEYDGKEFKIKYIDDDSHLKSSEIITYK